MTKPSKAKMRACHEGKHRYETEQQAKDAMHGWIHKRSKGKSPIVSVMHVYGCACGGFHIGRSRGINWDAVEKASKVVKLSEMHK